MYEQQNLNINAFRVKNLISKHIKDNELPYYVISSLPKNNLTTFLIVVGNEEYVSVEVKISLSEQDILALSYKLPFQNDWQKPSKFTEDLIELKKFLTTYK